MFGTLNLGNLGNLSPGAYTSTKGVGWWSSATYNAVDTADGVSKPPAAIADFRKWRFALPALGPELVTNGDFSNGTTGWNLPTGWTVSSNALVSTNVAAYSSMCAASLINNLAANSVYVVTFSITQNTSGSVRVQKNGGDYSGLTSRSGLGTYSEVFVPSSVLVGIGFQATTLFTGTIDNISVREVLTNGQMRSATFAEWFAFTSGGGTYVDANGTMQTAASNAPRMDYSTGVGRLGLNNAATNLCTYASDPTYATWSGIQISRDNGYGDPAGGALASRVTCTAVATAAHSYISATGYTAGTTYTLSRFVRPGTQTLVQLTGPTAAFGSAQYANFNLAAGTVTAAVGCTASIVNLGGSGWFRIAITVTATGTLSAAASGSLVFITSPTSLRFPAVTLTTYFFEAFPQCETGPIASPYIPTTGSPATRAIETCQFGAITTALMQRSAESVVVRYTLPATSGGKNTLVGAANPIQIISDEGIAQVGSWNGSVNLVATAGAGVITSPSGAAASFNAAGRAICLNGGSVASDAGSIGSVAAAYLGSNGPVRVASGHYDFLAIYPFRVANSDLPRLAVPA